MLLYKYKNYYIFNVYNKDWRKTMNMFQYLILTVAILSVVTTIHELGHFICAKTFKKTVSEFCIGCGPIIFRKGIFVLRLIPFLGYNMIELDINDSDIRELKKNLLILISGYITMIIIAIFIYPFSNAIAFLFLVSIIADSISSNTSDGKLAIIILKNISHKRSR